MPLPKAMLKALDTMVPPYGANMPAVCWAAGVEIKELRKKLKDIRKLTAETERRLAEGECDTDDLIALPKKVTRIVDR